MVLQASPQGLQAPHLRPLRGGPLEGLVPARGRRAWQPRGRTGGRSELEYGGGRGGRPSRAELGEGRHNTSSLLPRNSWLRAPAGYLWAPSNPNPALPMTNRGRGRGPEGAYRKGLACA